MKTRSISPFLIAVLLIGVLIVTIFQINLFPMFKNSNINRSSSLQSTTPTPYWTGYIQIVLYSPNGFPILDSIEILRIDSTEFNFKGYGYEVDANLQSHLVFFLTPAEFNALNDGALVALAYSGSSSGGVVARTYGTLNKSQLTNNRLVLNEELRAHRQRTLEQLTALRSQVTSSTQLATLDAVIDQVTASLDSALWSDSLHLNVPNGEEFFNADVAAFSELRQLEQDDPQSEPSKRAAGFMQRLLYVSRGVAASALEEAKTANCDQNLVSDLEQELQQAYRAQVLDQYEEAVTHARNVWNQAVHCASPTPTLTSTPTATNTPLPTQTPTPSVPQSFYLRGTGPNNNPPVLLLDSTAPTAATAKYKDSTSVNFNGGNSWKEIGTWLAAPTLTNGELSTLDDLHVWLGLKNSDDQGTRFDIRAEIYKNGMLISSGEIYCVQGITRNANNALETEVAFEPFGAHSFNGTTDVMTLKLLTRIGTNGSGGFCGGHSNAVGLRLYFDATNRPAKFDGVLVP